MYFLAGSSTPVRRRDVVAVIDTDGVMTMPDTADFLRRAERAGVTELAGDNLPKCAVLLAPPHRRTQKSKRKQPPRRCRVIFSTTSAAALRRRAKLRSGGFL